MIITKSIQNDKALVSIEGSFVYDIHREFRLCCDAVLSEPTVSVVEVDLARVDYLDSAALGMLLLLREKAQEKKAEVVIRNPTRDVRQIFDIVKFQDFFKIC